MFFDQFSDFLEHSDSLPGKTLLMGDFNFHFENCTTSKTFSTLLNPLLNALTTKAICLT